jgi:hypothetical protein
MAAGRGVNGDVQMLNPGLTQREGRVVPQPSLSLELEPAKHSTGGVASFGANHILD